VQRGGEKLRKWRGSVREAGMRDKREGLYQKTRWNEEFRQIFRRELHAISGFSTFSRLFGLWLLLVSSSKEHFASSTSRAFAGRNDCVS
jgi:hypothetical protein